MIQIVALILALFFVAAERPPIFTAQAGYIWERVTDQAAWEPRDGAGAVTFGGRMWMIGGWSPWVFPRITSNDAWSSADARIWQLEKPNSFTDAAFDSSRDFEGRHTFGAVVVRDEIILVGGDANQGHYQNDVWASVNGRDWTLRARDVPWGPRVLMDVGTLRDRIVLIGGQTLPQKAPAQDVRYRDAWVSDDAGATWQQIIPREPYWPYAGMTDRLVEWRGRLWRIGGGTYDTPAQTQRHYSSCVWSTADVETWIYHGCAPWAARQYHSVLVWDEAIWVMGGFDGRQNLGDTWYSRDGVTWTQVDTPWIARHAASVWAHDGQIMIAAGNNPVAGSQPTSDVWALRKRMVCK